MRIEKCVFGRGIGCSPQRHWPWPTYILFSHTLFTLTLCPILQRAMTLLWVLVPGASACKYLIGFQLPWKASPPSEPGRPPNFQVWELSLHASILMKLGYLGCILKELHTCLVIGEALRLLLFIDMGIVTQLEARLCMFARLIAVCDPFCWKWLNSWLWVSQWVTKVDIEVDGGSERYF